MAALQAQNLRLSSESSSVPYGSRFSASLHAPSNVRISLPKLPITNNITMGDLILREESTATRQSQTRTATRNKDEDLIITKLHAIAEAVADRAEMHAIIGEQRNNWNHLFLHSINSINLAASLMAGISSIPLGEANPHVLAFKLSSAALFAAATGMMLVVNKIQPSQLTEEQRNATRLWKQLERSIHATLALRAPTQLDADEAMEKVLALDKAYPLPLLPEMLEKFPETVEPTRWWPKLRRQEKRRETRPKYVNGVESNGWSKELEEEMKGILRVLKVKDEEQYVRLGKLVLNINKTLATSGPLLSGLAAIGAGLIGSPALGQLPVLLGVVGGSLAAVVNTLEHGGQVGMVFELFRNLGGFYRRLQEEIESNLGERDLQKRENGELFEIKMALQLGRSLPELRDLASYASPSFNDEDIKEFAGKLF